MKTIFTIITSILLAGCSANLSSFYLTESDKDRERIRQYEKELVEHRQRQRQEIVQIEQAARTQQEYRISPPAPLRPLPMAAPPPPPPLSFPKSQNQNTKSKETVSSKLVNANLAFAIKDQANIKEDIKAQLLIDFNQSTKELEDKLSVKGVKISQPIEISEIVKATITAPNFDISKITEEEQIISDYKPTEWLWILKPKSIGTHEVNLSVTALIKINGKETKHHLKTFDKNILIEITEKQIVVNWVEENWKWLISTLILPLIVFFYKRNKKN